MLPRFPLQHFANTPIRQVLKAGHRLCLDGGMGTYFFATLKLPRHDKLWMLPMISEKQRHDDVIKAHHHFIEAGADVIEPFNYCCTPFYLEMEGLNNDVTEMNYTAARLARKAVDTYQWKAKGEAPRKVWVAGALPPPGQSFHPGDQFTDAEYDTIYKQIIEGIKDNVDFLQAETLSSAREGVLIACAAEKHAPDKDLFICFTVDQEVKIRNGDQIQYALQLIQKAEIQNLIGFGINCSTPQDAQKGLEKMCKVTNKFLISYPNDLVTFPKDWVVSEAGGEHIAHLNTPAEKFREYARILLKNERLMILGGCCGTVPAHIAEIKKLIENV